jgi:hypothetical protein
MMKISKTFNETARDWPSLPDDAPDLLGITEYARQVVDRAMELVNSLQHQFKDHRTEIFQLRKQLASVKLQNFTHKENFLIRAAVDFVIAGCQYELEIVGELKQNNVFFDLESLIPQIAHEELLHDILEFVFIEAGAKQATVWVRNFEVALEHARKEIHEQN